MERWRQWTPPVEIIDHPEEIVIEGDHKSRALNVKWPEAVVEKIRLGYMCLKCMEPQEHAFPEACSNPVCQYPMRRDQAHDFGLEFMGTEQYVSDAQRDWEELERMDERAEKRLAAERRPGRIVVPNAPKKVTPGGVILPR